MMVRFVINEVKYCLQTIRNQKLNHTSLRFSKPTCKQPEKVSREIMCPQQCLLLINFRKLGKVSGKRVSLLLA